MKIGLNFSKTAPEHDINLFFAFNKGDKQISYTGWPKEIVNSFNHLKNTSFNGKLGESLQFSTSNGELVSCFGLGDKKEYTPERLRREISKIYKLFKKTHQKILINIDSFILKGNYEQTLAISSESLLLTEYKFDKYLTKESDQDSVIIFYSSKWKKSKKIEGALERAKVIAESMNFARDLINEPPNILHSEEFAKVIEKDAKKIAGVKVKILGQQEIKKEKMNLLLSVNAGSKYGPRVAHLTYSPKKTNSKTKHIALVGKGLTFDSGGYCLKPPTSMISMKGDMGGAATVYGAFRIASLLKANIKITCILGITDNMINSVANTPDTIIKARNGKTVEIVNTDAEGRLVLADILNYACDLKPDAIIDAATLTGAILVAIGQEMCGVMSNNKKLVSSIMKSAKNCDEYMWEMPIIQEFRDEMKTDIADLSNMGKSRFGGSSKAAAFLEYFIKDDIPWAHLDVAGCADTQSHLPYCPAKGGSGIIVRTVADYLLNE